MEQRTDRQLVASARAGNKEAFGYLVKRYYGMAVRVAAGMVDNEETARELVQEAMLRAYLSLDRLREQGAFKGWLYGIVLNVCRGCIRDRRRDAEVFGTRAHDLLRPMADPAPTPQELAEERELNRKVLEAVDTLSPAVRRATLLFYYESLSLQEIAAVQEVAVGTVKAQLHQARMRLRAHLLPVYGAFYATSKTQRSRAMIQAKIAVLYRVENRKVVVVLLDEESRRSLPVIVDGAEGDALVMGLSGSRSVRSGSYDLTIKLMEALGAELEAVRIEALDGKIFYAVVRFRQGDRVQELDARPGDALALAVGKGVPISVKKELLEGEWEDLTGLSFTGAASVVCLPHDEVKGKIVGKNGRNIITFETLTGVKVIVNDTPKAVTIVGSDPLRREIAQLALERLVREARFNPTRIAEAVSEARGDVEAALEEAVRQTGQGDVTVYCEVSRAYCRWVVALGRVFRGCSTNDREGIENQLKQYADLVRTAGCLRLHVVCNPAGGYGEMLQACADRLGYRVDTDEKGMDRFKGEFEKVHLFVQTPEKAHPSTSAVTVPDEAVKGRIIGREGRNVRAFEAATGVQAIVDGAIPTKVMLWSPDPAKLEVATMSLKQIVAEDRITPEAIEDIVEGCKARYYLKH